MVEQAEKARTAFAHKRLKATAVGGSPPHSSAHVRHRLAHPAASTCPSGGPPSCGQSTAHALAVHPHPEFAHLSHGAPWAEPDLLTTGERGWEAAEHWKTEKINVMQTPQPPLGCPSNLGVLMPCP